MAKKYVAVWRDSLFIGPSYMCEPGTLKQARKVISDTVRRDRWRGSRYAALWCHRPVRTMQAGDNVAVHIGKNGYHLWARYWIEESHG